MQVLFFSPALSFEELAVLSVSDDSQCPRFDSFLWRVPLAAYLAAQLHMKTIHIL